MVLRILSVFTALLFIVNSTNVAAKDASILRDTLPKAEPNLVALSEALLLAFRYDNELDSLTAVLADIHFEAMLSQLNDDTKKKAFWINLYNAFYQILYKENGLRPDAIFSEKAIDIASIAFSLDDIEHGVLRKYRHKYSLGYLPKWFPAKHIKALAVDTTDWRIHFALNCGAISCPPIAFYNSVNLEDQLDIATASFLSQETVVDEEQKILNVTKIMFWFKGDFGGNQGIRKVVSRVFNQDFDGYKINFQEYDWTAKLDYFVE